MKRVRTVSETVEIDNSGDANAKLDLKASVTVQGGKVSHIQSGTIEERGSRDATGMGMSAGTFAFPNGDSMDFHLYRRIEGMTRAEVVAAVEEFAERIKSEFSEETVTND